MKGSSNRENAVNDIRRVAIVAYDQLSLFEFGCALELFALPRPGFSEWYQTDVLALEKTSLTSMAGLSVKCTQLFSDLDDYDMLVIPGWSSIKNPPPQQLLTAMQSLHKRGGRIVSFCSGAFAVAASGLLDGGKATTHWQYAEDFSAKFPHIEFVENVLYTDENRICTSAGSASGLDLGIHIIRQDFGAKVANRVAKRLVISASREGGQAQYSEQYSSEEQEPSRLTNTMDWVRDNLDQSISVQQMADFACLSRRSFDRKFRHSVGYSPKVWLIKQRINLAREYLESSRWSIEIIADKSGFNTAMNLRHHFAKILGVSPQRYRQQFMRE